MEKLKIKEIKEIFKFVGIKGYSGLKKKELLEKMKNEGIYDNYLKKKKDNDPRNKKQLFIEEFNKTVNFKDLYNEDESDTEDSVHEDDFELIYDKLILYGDYDEVEEKMNEKNSDKKKKEFLISTGLIDETDYKFGNSLQFSTNRAHSRYYIGKNDELIVPEMFMDGDLVIPYEITKFNKNATVAFKDEEYESIYLRHDDKFVQKYIQGKILKKWNWIILFDNLRDCFRITFPNGYFRECKKHTHVRDILNFLEKTNCKKIRINLEITYTNKIKRIYDYLPLRPSSWIEKSGGSSFGPDGGKNYISYIGPENEKNAMEVLIKKSLDIDEISYNLSVSERLF